MFFFLTQNIVPSFTVTYPRFPMIKWLQRKYEESELAQWLAGLVAEYGPAWVVSAQIVGWFCFFVLWALLIVADVHPSRIADSFQLADDSLWRYYIDVYGVPAAAYVLNRIIFPIRIAMEIVLVRQIHKPVNAVLKPHWDWFWGGLFSCLGCTSGTREDVDGEEDEEDGDVTEMAEYKGVPESDALDDQDEEEANDDLATLCVNDGDSIIAGKASKDSSRH